MGTSIKARVVPTLPPARMLPNLTWQRLASTKPPGFGKWERPSTLRPFSYWDMHLLMQILPPECISPGGKLRSPIPGIRMQTLLWALQDLPRYQLGQFQNYQVFIEDRRRATIALLDWPPEQIEARATMNGMRRLVA